MIDRRYERIADKHKAKENRVYNAFISFVSGGIIGLTAEAIIELLCRFNYSRTDAGTLMIVIYIFIGCFLTAIGVFDKLVSKFKCGLLIPITGFAHSMMSSAMDYKREGPIYGIGSNIFKLTGSVLLYGIVSAWFFGTIRYIIGGVG